MLSVETELRFGRENIQSVTGGVETRGMFLAVTDGYSVQVHLG